MRPSPDHTGETEGGQSNREGNFRAAINVHDPAEAKWLSHELGVSRDMHSLIDKVGKSATTVRKELAREKSNGGA